MTIIVIEIDVAYENVLEESLEPILNNNNTSLIGIKSNGPAGGFPLCKFRFKDKETAVKALKEFWDIEQEDLHLYLD